MYSRISKLGRLLPDTLWRRELEWRYRSPKMKPLFEELSKISISESGSESLENHEVPFVVLPDGTVLCGRASSPFEKEIYRRNKYALPSSINEETIKVAIDVILRYLYPHAMPQLQLPYSRQERTCFHPQHVETIRDIPELTLSDRNELMRVYSLTPGESFLDIGAYMGFGTLRLRGELGPSSKIISVEADPDNFSLLRTNVDQNRLDNISLINKAIWKEENLSMNLYRSRHQANSLVENVVQSAQTYPVVTTTVDDILREEKMESVDIISITVNGAEVEAVQGMQKTVENAEHIRLSIAGWYKRGGQRICDVISPILRSYELNVVIGERGGVLAWK